MMVLESLCDIIASEMNLDRDQLFIMGERFTVPRDERLYISVALLSAKPFSSGAPVGGDEQESSVNMSAAIQVDLFSKELESLERKEEVILALRSAYSLQVQAARGFLIARVTSAINNLSGVEGPGIPYRFSFTVNLQYRVSKVKSVEFYDTFNRSLKTES